jgi:hypothetical protein
MGAHHGALVSKAREIAMLARYREVGLDEATELIETYARVIAAEALAKHTAKAYHEILAKLASATNAPLTSWNLSGNPVAREEVAGS